MKKSDKLIKIKIENHPYTKEDLEDVIRWEDEGGMALNTKDLPSSVTPPIKPGEIFEVVEGDVIYEDNEPYYLAKINLLALH